MFSRGERIFAMYVANFMEQFVMCYHRLWIKKKLDERCTVANMLKLVCHATI